VPQDELCDTEREGRTVLVSSHLLAEIAPTVDDVIVINRGRLIVHGPMSQLIGSNYATSLEELFFDLVAKALRPLPAI
jgi:ABC-2 type transport system ATP-binding protein